MWGVERGRSHGSAKKDAIRQVSDAERTAKPPREGEALTSGPYLLCIVRMSAI